jgi:hypothetical protein
MPSRCSAGCHAPCSSAALRSGSSYVRHQALFIRSSFTHCTMLTALVWRCAGPQLQAHSSFLVYTITSPANTLFAWFHSLIRHYFISASCRPSAAFCSYARRQAIACVPGLHWHKPSLMYHATFRPFTVRPSQPRPAALLDTPGVGIRRPFPFIRPSFTPSAVYRLAKPNTTSRFETIMNF